MYAAGASSGSSPSWSGPGIIQALITSREGSKLSQQTLEKWFHEVYLPAVLKTGIVESITSWKSANSQYERPWMIVFEVPNLEMVEFGDAKHKAGGGLHGIPRTSDLFPTEGPVDDFVDFESRILSQVELYGENGNTADEVDTIIYAAMQPAAGGEKELDDWYRQEHNEQMSKEPGYKRTSRYNPLYQTRNIGKPTCLDFVAFHQFGEGNRVGTEVEPLNPMTDWTKKCMGQCTSIDAAVYRKVKTLRA